MRKKRFSLALILMCFVGLGQMQAQEKVKLRILTYNLRFGELASLEELGNYIKEFDPDLVALQEVDVRTNRDRATHQNGKDFITELGHYSNMFSLYGKTIDYMGGYYGVGILSKYPYTKMERILLPNPEPKKEQRAYLVSEIELPNDKSVRFVSTHLDYAASSTRQLQVEAFTKDLESREGPTIICGDFNARPESPEVEQGMADWLFASSFSATMSAVSPINKIDYIFCYPKQSWKLIETKTPHVQLSDHLPVFSVIELTY